jgi:TolB-like protein/Tfp pilus assembly protein PilF
VAILKQLQRRKVIRAAAVYLLVAWLLLQVAATIAPIMNLPHWFEKLVLALLILGFPVALILAWSLELTPDGFAPDSSSQSSRSARVVDYSLLTIIGVGLIWLAYDRRLPNEALITTDLDRSVAILPFVNLNGDDANAAFTSGIHADLLTQLARIKTVRTVSRTTMLRYRDSPASIAEIGAELDVATIVEGGVQRAGDTVRINVQLIDAAADRALWTEAFERELTAANVFAIQGEIARAIAGRLQASLSPDDHKRLDSVPTQSLAALDAYFVGKRLLEDRTRESLHVAAEHFENAVEMDPNFALGWSGLADAYMLLPEYSYTVDREMVTRRSREAMLRALELDPSLPEVRNTEAWFQLTRNYDWAGAEAIFTDALDAFPDNANLLHWMSHTLSWQGRQAEGLVLAKHAVEVEPESHLMRMNLAYILTDAGQFDAAQKIGREVRDRFPKYLGQRRNLYLHELRAGAVVEGADSFVTYTTIIGGDPAVARTIGDMFIVYARDGTVGDISEEMIELAHLGTEDLAQVLAFVGDAEATLAALTVAVEERSASRSALSMKINPAYDFVRDDPRFVILLGKAGLAD